ncbi:probable serine/threonine-protein kinase clkA isoform X1 [Ptychodera flava]|uniref:probable serine/threonine-protein kinase clkA isoform X1 n=1 Tax=Ptychodera flava TaxID=63121 RepID=UPI00396A1AF6
MVKLETRIQTLQNELENAYAEAQTWRENSYETLPDGTDGQYEPLRDFCPGNYNSIEEDEVINMEDQSDKNTESDNGNNDFEIKDLATNGPETGINVANVAIHDEHLRDQHDISSQDQHGYENTKNSDLGGNGESEENENCVPITSCDRYKNIERRDHLTSVELHGYENIKSNDDAHNTFDSLDSLEGEACSGSFRVYKNIGIENGIKSIDLHWFENANHDIDFYADGDSVRDDMSLCIPITTCLERRNNLKDDNDESADPHEHETTKCDDKAANDESTEPHEYENTKCDDKAENDVDSEGKDGCRQTDSSHGYKNIGNEKGAMFSNLHGLVNTRKSNVVNKIASTLENDACKGTIQTDDEVKSVRNDDEIMQTDLTENDNTICISNVDIGAEITENEACMHSSSSVPNENIVSGGDIASSIPRGYENTKGNNYSGNDVNEKNDPSKCLHLAACDCQIDVTIDDDTMSRDGHVSENTK